MNTMLIPAEFRIDRQVEIGNIRIALHKHIYTIDIIGKLIEDLYNIDPFSVVYDANSRALHIKMKKTAIKKYTNYSKDLSFFYQFFSVYIKNFLYHMADNISLALQYDGIIISPDDIRDILNTYIYSFFTLTLLNDNFIILHL